MIPGLELTLADVRRLIEEPSAGARADTAARVARVFAAPTLTENERAIARDVLTLLARDAEVHVRHALAENLKDNPDIPHELAQRLARDVAEVATPILEFSKVLSDDELLAVIFAESNQHQAAIARRNQVSPALSSALVEIGDEKVVAALMKNDTASISDRTMHRAVDRFGHDGSVSEAMAHRPQLPMAVTERLVTLVSESLRDHLVMHHDLPAETAADLTLQSREKALLGLVADNAQRTELADLVHGLNQNRRLTPSLILRALLTGDIDFFEHALAELGGISISNAHVLIHDRGGNGLESLHRHCRLPNDMLPIVRTAVHVIGETQYDGGPADRPRFVKRVIERILTQLDGPLGGDEVDWLIRRLTRAQKAVHAAGH